jgi:hypothetical protein
MSSSALSIVNGPRHLKVMVFLLYLFKKHTEKVYEVDIKEWKSPK